MDEIKKVEAVYTKINIGAPYAVDMEDIDTEFKFKLHYLWSWKEAWIEYQHKNWLKKTLKEAEDYIRRQVDADVDRMMREALCGDKDE